jgi:hypothetical protein
MGQGLGQRGPLADADADTDTEGEGEGEGSKGPERHSAKEAAARRAGDAKGVAPRFRLPASASPSDADADAEYDVEAESEDDGDAGVAEGFEGGAGGDERVWRDMPSAAASGRSGRRRGGAGGGGDAMRSRNRHRNGGAGPGPLFEFQGAYQRMLSPAELAAASASALHTASCACGHASALLLREGLAAALANRLFNRAPTVPPSTASDPAVAAAGSITR